MQSVYVRIVINFVCATIRAVILDLAEYDNSKTFVNCVKKLIARPVAQQILFQIIRQNSNQGKMRTFVQVKSSNSKPT